MRPIEDIHGDYWDVATLDGSTQELEAATINLVKDIPDLLAALAEEKAANAQERHSVKVLMGIELADKDVETRQALMWYKEALADIVAKDAEIEKLREIEQLADALITRITYANERLPEPQALGTAIAYGPETMKLIEAIACYETREESDDDC